MSGPSEIQESHAIRSMRPQAVSLQASPPDLAASQLAQPHIFFLQNVSPLCSKKMLVSGGDLPGLPGQAEAVQPVERHVSISATRAPGTIIKDVTGSS